MQYLNTLNHVWSLNKGFIKVANVRKSALFKTASLCLGYNKINSLKSLFGTVLEIMNLVYCIVCL